MSLIKSFLKKITPAGLIEIYRNFKPYKTVNMWNGNYNSWEVAVNDCTGYDSPLILEKCKNAILKVKNGKAAYERDSVLFDKVEYSWPLVAFLLKAAIENNNKLSVIDFGGSLGSSYFQNKSIIPANVSLSWSVVEQERFVEAGINEIKNEELDFYSTIEQASKKHGAHVLLLSSVIQYLQNPYDFLSTFVAYNFKYIIIDRTTIIDDLKARLTIQKVPESIYQASYPCWFFNEQELLNIFLNKYELITQFDSYADPCKVSEDGKQMHWKGYCLKLKN